MVSPDFQGENIKRYLRVSEIGKNRYGVPRFPDFLCYGFFNSPNGSG